MIQEVDWNSISANVLPKRRQQLMPVKQSFEPEVQKYSYTVPMLVVVTPNYALRHVKE